MKKYTLPNGGYTDSPTRLSKEYHKFVKPICKATGAELHSFGPGVALTIYHESDTEKKHGIVFSLPMDFIRKLNEKLK